MVNQVDPSIDLLRKLEEAIECYHKGLNTDMIELIITQKAEIEHLKIQIERLARLI